MIVSRSRLTALAVAGALAGAAFVATPAKAWWRGGVWIGVPPVVVGPPAYYPPPYPYYYPPPYPSAYPYYPYYPPAYPPGYAAPPPPAQTPMPQTQSGDTAQTPSNQPVAYGATCYAGVYTCAAAANTPVGAVCSCPGLGAPSYGSAH
jgi:hypothetical protein